MLMPKAPSLAAKEEIQVELSKQSGEGRQESALPLSLPAPRPCLRSLDDENLVAVILLPLTSKCGDYNSMPLGPNNKPTSFCFVFFLR